MERKNQAHKGWGNCMESFISNEGDSSLLSDFPEFTPDCKVDISWSSSSEDENASTRSKKKKVVTRLNFDECISRSSGQVTPLYSRYLSDADSAEKDKNSGECVISGNKGCPTTPAKEIYLQPADVNHPTSPVIMKRKRRRSLADKDVSPVIKRSFKKVRNIASELIKSPGSVSSESDDPLDKSLSDLITPLKTDDDFKKSTNITPALEGMSMRSLLIHGRVTLGTEEKAPKKLSPSSPSPVIEIASSQDVQMESATTEESQKIKETQSESHNESSSGINSSQGLPLSAVITASASPTLNRSAMNESEMSVSYDWDTSFSLLPNVMTTPVKNSSIPLEDPESGRKRKRLKKGGLAIRLQRLLNREQSWRRMWKHERLGKMNTADDSSITLLVLSIWSEATKILMHCKVETKPKHPVQKLNDSVVLLLDPLAAGERGIRAGCSLKLYPPWQTLMLGNNQIPVLLCANLIEVLQSGDIPVLPKKENVVLKEYNCHCIEGKQKECSFRFEFGGLEFLSKLMPSLGAGLISMENGNDAVEPMLVSTQMPPECDASTSTGSERRKEGTVSWIVADHSQRGGCIGGTYLVARVQRIFCYRNPHQKSSIAKERISSLKNYETLWSALLQDSAGEFCEVEFNRQRIQSSQEKPPDNQTIYWGKTDAASALQEGAILHLNGLKILRRSDGNKTRGLPAIMNALRMEMKAKLEYTGSRSDVGRCVNGQSFVYTFAPEEEGYLDKLNEETSLPSCTNPIVQSLYDSLHGWEAKDSVPKVTEGQRVTVIVKVLFSVPSVDGKVTLKLFVTDPSLSALNSRDRKSVLWVPFIIKSSCCPPPLLTQWLSCSSLSNPVPVMCLQDVELYGGELIGDHYSRIFLASENGVAIPSWMSAHEDLLSFTRSSLVPRVSSIKSTSVPGEVVSITGNIVGVDEETAFSWPACSMCGNDHLSEVEVAGSNSHQSAYHCARCQSLVDKPFTKMSLDAFLACSTLPPERCRIKVKLYQKSIMELLPPSNQHVGYELASVLGKLIGPLYCLLVSTHKHFQKGQAADLVFTAEELKCFVNIP